MKLFRTIIYVDGFNLYYGALLGTLYKWLDVKLLAKNILSPQDRIVGIKYFTARVEGREDETTPIRQNIYLRALEAHIPELSIIYGNFSSREKSVRLAEPIVYGNFSAHESSVSLPQPIDGRLYTKIIKTEEKGSDVNLSVHLVNDACRNRFDCALVISNDSDLTEAVRLVVEDHNKTVGVANPQAHFSKRLKKAASFAKQIRPSALAKSQLPERIPGTNLRKPEKWC